MIIYIHGYRASLSGGKLDILKEHFPNVVAFDHNDMLPHDIIARISSLIKENYDDTPMLVGSSLGGFYALATLQRFSVKAMLLNPSVHPWKTLGNNENPPSDEYIRQLNELKLDEPKNLEYTYLAVNKDDTVLDSSISLDFCDDARKKIVFETGGHRMENFTDVINHIKELEAL